MSKPSSYNKSGDSKRNRTNNSNNYSKNSSSFDLMPENFKLIKTIKYRGKKRKINELKPAQKFSIDEVKKQINDSKNRTDENVEKLLRFGKTTMDDSTIETLVRRAKAGHYIIPEVKKKVEEESIFTEEDFKNLEKELYFEN